MAKSNTGVNSPRAVKRFSGDLALDVSQQSYFGRRFAAVGQGAKTPIQILTDLESEAGDLVTYDLLTELRMAPVEGDSVLEGKEEAQKFYTDQLYIDQARGGVNTGGRMSRKRTLHDLRTRGKAQQASWWGRFQDELTFTYLSGSRGVNENFILPFGYTGRANNPLTPPTANHQLFGGDATSTGNIDATDKMALKLVGDARTRADTQGGGATNIPVMQPCSVDGEDVFVMVMHVWQEDDMRNELGASGWLEIQKALAAATGMKSPLVRNALGMHRNVVLHSHRNVIRHSTHGAAGNVATARALFMGSQAGVMAFGSPGTGMRYGWHEETRDNGNQVVITTSSIFGVKKTTFDWDGVTHDQGVFAVETACAPR
ncbi:N4-gp56 family major capsid protein [Paracidovorax oryzae]|uniref:N4-gp56 family major capsid protein n=1 Tax=Paracidovorax oryzae TaxID=862720 RepID=UPI0002F380C5|nr:N4-gp56 family major capsid protein [Paracidovorax oryzae]